MSWKSTLFNSFIRGLGKTSAALVVCGFLAGTWTLFTTLSSKKSNIINYKNKDNTDDKSSDKDVDNLNTSDNDKNENDIDSFFNYSNNSDKNFKMIFDNL